jgi:hypothetical protein
MARIYPKITPTAKKLEEMCNATPSASHKQ